MLFLTLFTFYRLTLFARNCCEYHDGYTQQHDFKVDHHQRYWLTNRLINLVTSPTEAFL